MKTSKKNFNPYRLSQDCVPTFYSIELEPNLKAFTFKGGETIFFDVKKSAQKITLHAIELKILKAVCEDLQVKKITYNEKMETVTLDFGKKIPTGKKKRLVLEFEGTLNDKMHGFYRTSYQVDGEKRWGAATQFEATDARRAFPCWDEPAFKAKFEIILKVPIHLTALSNMPVKDEQVNRPAGIKRIVYDVSPIMSTYLVAFVIADLESVEANDKNGVTIRVWTTTGKKEQGRFALDVALHTLPYFSNWFGIPYALPKLDMVSLPDFASGAMENWGLVTYRETALLVDEKNSSAAAKQRVAEVIDHELAHQWFGNLVTMEWWTDLWLNEGFASYMGPKAVAHQFPEWDMWNQYVVEEYLTALHDDSLKNTHPIEIPVQNPHEIREIFDHITYSKGSVVNRMLEHFLGENAFQKGLRAYLKKYAYQNARTIDLWTSLEAVSGKPVKAIMAGYTRQGGYPVITIEANAGKKPTKLSQRRFMFDGSKDSKNPQWVVPIDAASFDSKKSAQFILNKKNQTSADLAKFSQEAFKLNKNQSGFYRVVYPAQSLERLKPLLEQRKLSVIDTLGILDDVFSMTRAHFLKTSAGLDFAKAAKNQTDYNVWSLVAGFLGQIENWAAPETKPLLATFSRQLFSPTGQRLGWTKKPTDKHTDILLRSMTLGRLGHYGDIKVIAEAQALFKYFCEKGELEPDLRGVVYSLTAENGTEREFEQILNLYEKFNLQEEKVRLLRSISRFKIKALIERALEFSLSDKVRPQDTPIVLASFGGNDAARKLAWAFVKARWKTLVERYHGGSLGLLSRIFEGVASGFHAKEDLADVKRFFEQHPLEGTERAMKQTVEVIHSNVAWSSRDKKETHQWLEKDAS